jgi:hypothetical protein
MFSIWQYVRNKDQQIVSEEATPMEKCNKSKIGSNGQRKEGCYGF